MLMKVILYAYTQKTSSSQKIAQMVRENIPMIWLAGMQTTDHRTINDFRGIRMSKMMESVFEQFLIQLVEQNLIDLDHMFVDGTKIEANANKYRFVWRKSLENYDKKLRVKIKSLIQEIREVTQAELEAEKLEEELVNTVEQLTESVQELETQYEQESDKEKRKAFRSKKSELKKQLKTIESDYLPRLRKYKVKRTFWANEIAIQKQTTMPRLCE